MRLAVLVALLFALIAPGAQACRCVVPATPQEDLGAADGAFYGTVTGRAIADEGNPDVQGDEYIDYTFAIDADYKDNLPDELQLGFPVASAACGLDLDVGDNL